MIFFKLIAFCIKPFVPQYYHICPSITLQFIITIIILLTTTTIVVVVVVVVVWVYNVTGLGRKNHCETDPESN